MYKYIYKITNILDNKCYIGQTNNCDRRFSEHKCLKYESSPKLRNAMLKHGVDNFRFEVIGGGENYNDLEKYYIKLYDSINHGYNITEGGEEPPVHHGENHFNAKLSLVEVDNIRKMLIDKVDKKIISETFKIGISNINRINRGVLWYDENLDYPLTSRLTNEDIEGITNDLLNTNMTQKQIASKYKVARSLVTNINIGYDEKHKRDNIQYPIRTGRVAYYNTSSNKLVYYK